MCQVISYCRTVPAGKSLDAAADRLRHHVLRPIVHSGPPRSIAGHIATTATKRPRQIVLLSRVTIGADVAILSVMIQRLRRLFPEADLVIVGSRKLHGLFGGNPDLRIRELSYARRGGLFERFAGWHAALDILHEESADVGEENVLVIDPGFAHHPARRAAADARRQLPVLQHAGPRARPPTGGAWPKGRTTG